tara:strand:- start:296 stop:481 length:186 start_codon:yes stop_codon:yes gene_type:complete
MWSVVFYSNENKSEVVKVLDFTTIKELSYCIETPTPTISNYYHKLIKPRGILKNIDIYKSE